MTAHLSHSGPADTVLIRQFLDGSEQAFRRLYQRHTPRLRMMLLRVLDYRDADADDVLQETWLACCRGLHAFRGESRFDTWLTTIGLRNARRRMSREPAEPDPIESIDLHAAPQAPPPVDARIDVEQVLRQLSARGRVIFTLHYLHGFSHDEIARELGIEPGSSRAALSRALTALRAHFHAEMIHGE